MSIQPRDTQLAAGLKPAGRRWLSWRDLRFQVKRNPLGATAAVLCLLFIFLGLFAPWLTPYSPYANLGAALQAPSSNHWFGTDQNGRDVFSRVLMGARVSLIVGVVVVAGASALGTVIGLVSGYFEGKTDFILQRITDTFLTFPALLLALALVSVMHPGMWPAIISITLVLWPTCARVIRAQVLSSKHNQYVDAARAIGASHIRILFRHLLPNVFASVLVLLSLWIGTAIVIEASLSFLGAGTQPPNPSWGRMLSSEGREYLERAPWLAIFPGLAISIVVFAFNLFGDTVRDVVDPRLRGN
ncbi:MAG: ABC transporter permease [Chloroflexi bacterium]|nr:ABC transporter permease [Chloroflexota bacterium]